MFENYDHKKLYLVACSGGPDSMALLDMLVKNNFNLIVAHVNYKTRQESDSEEILVRTYCKQNNIEIYVSIFNETFKGKSFEDVARKYRYKFFSKIYKEKNCDGLFVAHHKDDLLETYLLKKQRNVINESYLLQEKTIIENMNVYRPLINDFYKDDLLNYCHKNNIKYGIDYTNFLDIHPRNVIRKKLENVDKNEIFEMALKDEFILSQTRKEVKDYIRYYPIYLINDLKDKNDTWLMIFLYEKCKPKYTNKVKKSLLLTLKDYMCSKKPNLSYRIEDNLYLIKKYQEIEIKEIKENVEFSYVLDNNQSISTPYFKTVDNGLKMEGIYLNENDFPITIRNCKSEDKIKLKDGYKKINRLFIDKKVPINQRNKVIIIENKDKEIIFVYKLYRKQGLKDVKNNFYIKSLI